MIGLCKGNCSTKILAFLILTILEVSDAMAIENRDLIYYENEYKCSVKVLIDDNIINLTYNINIDRSVKNAHVIFVSPPIVSETPSGLIKNIEDLNLVLSTFKGKAITLPYDEENEKFDIKRISDISLNISEEVENLDKEIEFEKISDMLSTLVTNIYTSMIFNIILPDISSSDLESDRYDFNINTITNGFSCITIFENGLYIKSREITKSISETMSIKYVIYSE